MPDIAAHIAHITLPDGTRWQVLNEAGDDWDEAATSAAVAEHLRALATAQHPATPQPDVTE